MNVAYLGPLQDYSGYGEANRHDIAALEAAGVNVTGQLVSYVRDMTDFGELGKIVNATLERKDPYKVKILHTTPDQFHRYIEKGVYTIARFFWETDKVPKDFAEGLKLCDEIWTGSQANKEAIIKAGVDKPIYIFPQATQAKRDWPEKYELPGFREDGFLFYSIFEWIDRKNPAALLNAYWQEFQAGENVGLLLKTYFRDFTHMNKQKIFQEIDILKKKSGLSEFPPIYIYKELMDRKQIMRLHKTGDCFVSAHRGEGWGIPQVEAMLAGNPIISTNFGGVHEYLTNGKDATLLDYSMVTVRGMEHSDRWYTRDQHWAEVDSDQLRAALRRAFEDRNHNDAIARAGKKTVEKKFNLKAVGGLLADRLSEIERSLT